MAVRADAQGPPWARKSVAGKMPSPRLASVLRHRPATAPLRAIAATSGSAWVAWTRHQRWSTATFSYSHCNGRRPLQARQSSTSFCCSAIWMWTGRSSWPAARTGDLLRSHRAQGVEAQAQGVACRLQRRAQALEQFQVGLAAIDEAPLALAGRLGRRSLRDCKARAAGSGRYLWRWRRGRCAGKVRRGRRRAAVEVVMDVVEFRHRGVAGLEHLDVELAGDDLDLFGDSRATIRYISSRQVQKLSLGLPATSASPAMARWNACEWRLGIPAARPPRRSAPSALASGRIPRGLRPRKSRNGHFAPSLPAATHVQRKLRT
ncbi:Uncharacterised protein [Pseudomonas aeruginosa]|nr:Uncharacterised protein [Pseudomonas aeruginosa]